MDKDDILRRIKEKLYGFGRAGLMSATIFEGIVKAIIQQQISLKVAESITANLVEMHGYRVRFLGECIYDFPDAERLTKISVDELRRCGLSSRKSEYIKGFSEDVMSGFDPEMLRKMEKEEILDILTSFKGIGRWTAELVMVASIGLDVVPADDLGVRKAISHFYFHDHLQPPDVVREFVERRFKGYIRDCIVYLLLAYRMGL